MPNKRQALFTLIWVVVNEVTMAFAALGFCALHCAYDPLQEHSSTRWMPLGIITFCRARDLGERRCTTENTCSRPPPHQPSCGCATSPQLRMQCRTQLVPPCTARVLIIAPAPLPPHSRTVHAQALSLKTGTVASPVSSPRCSH